MVQIETSKNIDEKPARDSGFAWLRSWDIYLVALVAAFLRFYQIQTTEFDDDQAILFRMAYDAVHHGLLPVTSNIASIGIAHPPGAIYLYMLPAALSANPLWGAVLVGIFTTAAAVLTCIFTRRYYGRAAGLIAALLYATAARPLLYARFMWQPNLMPPFVLLFLFALFRGVVDRRKGWFFFALLLLGVLFQMHPIASLMAFPLLAALILAPGTLRWRDLVLGAVALVVIFFPYLLWEAFTRLADLRTVFSLAKEHARIDGQALGFYRLFLSPFDSPPAYPTSVVRALAPALSWLGYVVPLLALGGFALAALTLLARDGVELSRQGGKLLSQLLLWWRGLRADPYRCGLALLLVWQIVPLLFLLRHAVNLHAQYFFMLMPGPFILIGLLFARSTAWLARLRPAWRFARYGVHALAALIICAQLVGSTASVIDTSSGHFDDRGFQPYPYHNDLASLQRALSAADQLARRSHINHVYITTDAATRTALNYLAEQMYTPTTLFDASSCLALPGPAHGSAVLLVGPYDRLTNDLLGQVAHARLVERLERPGGQPFRLYIVTSAPARPLSQAQFVPHLQLLGQQQSYVAADHSSWLVTRWSFMHAAPPALRTTYNFALMARPGGSSGPPLQSLCTLTSMRPGDQLVAAFNLPVHAAAAPSVTLNVQSFMTVPYNPSYGPLHLETDSSRNSPRVTLRTAKGQDSITVRVRKGV